MNVAFVLGNGTSRSEVDLNKLKEQGIVYGCNALYREFAPHYLVAVDPKMIFEIAESKYQLTHNVWTNPNTRFKDLLGFKYFDKSKGWSSGPTALDLAGSHGYDEIYILGFDYIGLNQGKSINNIYADTPNYKKSTDTATYHHNWLRQTRQTIINYPKTQFYRVIKAYNYCPPELNIDNNHTITFEDFYKKFERSPVAAEN